MYRPDRRRFIKTSTIGASCVFLTAPAFPRVSIRSDTKPAPQKTVIKRKLGRTGLELPIVSFGVMRADNPGLVRAALEAGIQFFDTAHGYQKGRNEEMLGEILKDHPRNSFRIATKVPPDDRDTFLENFNISLQRLKMDYVDILYLHGLTDRDAVLNPEMLEVMKGLKESGKAKHVGFSTHRNEPEVILAAIESGVHEVVLTSVNFKQDHYPQVREAIAKAAAVGIGIVAMKTMAGAFLDKEKQKPINCKAALKWVLQDENVTTAIPGITTYEQLRENASVNTDLTLTEKEKADLALVKGESGLYCQGCERCIGDCRKGLPIPEIMRAYMYTYGYRDVAMARTLLQTIGLERNPCTDCSHCSVTCVKGFHVAEKVADVSRLASVPEEFLT